MIARTITWKRIAAAAAMLPVSGTAFGLWGWTHRRVETHIYTASEFGGYVGANRKRLPDTLLQRASDAYAAGRYSEAEQIANEIVGSARATSPPNPHSPGRSLRLAGRGGPDTASPAHPDIQSPAHDASPLAPNPGVRPPTPQSALRPPTPQSWGTPGAKGEGGLGDSAAGSLIAASPSDALFARRILAYSSARHGKFVEAKARFGALR